ncbi:MAG: hypothetical protein R2722_17835 [Tessaracoccus sp.]
MHGTGGQSFGAFLPRGVTLRLVGETRTTSAKGLSGGRLIVAPPPDGSTPPSRSWPAMSSPTARPRASCSCAAASVSGSACATRARPPSSRAWAITAVST